MRLALCRNSARAVFALLFAVEGLGYPTAAAVIEVGDDCSLTSAIDAANADRATNGCPAGSGADEIVLTDDVVLDSVHHFEKGPNGLPSIQSEITISGNGRTVRRGGGFPPDFRILLVGSDGVLTLEDIRIANGSAVDDLPACWQGGGILVDGGTLLAVRTSVIDSYACSYGSGLSTQLGTVTLISSRISGNSRQGWPGVGITNDGGQMTLLNTTVADNGTGILNYQEDATLSIIDSWIYDNDFKPLQNEGQLILSGSSLTENTGTAGALYNVSGSAIVTNTTISGNSRGIDNGVPYNGGPPVLYLRNSSVINNDGLGIYNDYFYGGGTTFIENTLFANNGSNCFAFAGLFDDGGNFDDDGSCPGAEAITGISLELADNGGPTPTHALLEGSTAIDAAGDCGLESDQRGFRRADGICDSGPFEAGALPSGPVLYAIGDCPGRMTLSLSGGTPGGSASIVRGSAPGSTLIPDGPCAGVELEISEANLVVTAPLDFAGAKVVTRDLTDVHCGAYLQAIDMATCAVGRVTQIP